MTDVWTYKRKRPFARRAEDGPLTVALSDNMTGVSILS